MARSPQADDVRLQGHISVARARRLQHSADAAVPLAGRQRWADGVEDAFFAPAGRSSGGAAAAAAPPELRSEEHTSGLQSRGPLVSRPLLAENKSPASFSAELTRSC